MKLGEILTGASNAMGGFTDALNAIKLGEFGLAFKIAFESIKLQAADSINSIAANVMAAVQASGAFLLAAFGPGSGIFTIVSAQFDIIAAKFSTSMLKAISLVTDQIPGMEKIFSDAIASNAKTITDSQNKISNSIGQISGDFKLAGQEASKAYDEALSSSKQLIDTSAIALELKKHQTELNVLEAKARSKAAEDAMKNLTIEEQGLKIAKDRLTHEERIKELDVDIASAKRQGNKEELAALEAMKAFHLELEASKKKGLSLDEAMANANKARQNIIDGVIEKNKKDLEGKREITKELEKQLGLGQQIIADANAAQRKDRLDPGGRLQKQAAEATGKGNFAEARRIGRQLRSREFDQSFEEAVGKGDINQMAREAGIDTFRKTARQIKEELMKKRLDDLKPKKEAEEAKKKKDEEKRAVEKPENILQKSVDAIKTAVEILEKKLPMPALGA